MRTTLTLAVVATGLAVFAAAPAQASPLQCSGAVAVIAPSEDGLEGQWRSQVGSSLGTDWSDFSLAKNKRYDNQNLGLGTLWTLSAQPCRHASIVQQIGALTDIHGLLQQGPGPSSNDDGPASHIGSKAWKSKFGH